MSENINQVTLALELLVTFAGVFLAFMLDRLIDWTRDQKTKQYLLRNLAYELNKVKNNLAGEPTRLYHDAYDSAIASGKLNLLSSEQVMKIANVYVKVRNANYRAIRARIAKEAFERNRNLESQEQYSFQSNEYNSTKQETSKMIAALLEEPWLSRYAQKS